LQRNDIVEKKKVLFDGVEVPGLINVPAIPENEGTADVPSFSKIVTVRNGITVFPAFDLTYKISQGTITLQFFHDFKNNNEVKDCTIIRVDAHGVEFSRKLYLACECYRLEESGYDAATPVPASITVGLTPWEIKKIKTT